VTSRNAEGKGESVIAPDEIGGCNKERALRTIGFLDTGVRQAFLAGEVGVEDTKTILDQMKKARERCQSGDVNACQVLAQLTAGLSQESLEEAESQV